MISSPWTLVIQILIVILLGSFPPPQQPATTSFHNLNTRCIICLCLLLSLLSLQSCPFVEQVDPFMPLKIVPSLLYHLPVTSFQPLFFLFPIIFEKSLYICFKEQNNLVSSVTYIFHCCKHPCWGCWASQIFGAIEKCNLEAICQPVFEIWRFVNAYLRKGFEEKE